MPACGEEPPLPKSPIVQSSTVESEFILEVFEGRADPTDEQLIGIQSELDAWTEEEGQPSTLELRLAIQKLFRAREAAFDPELAFPAARNDYIIADLFEYAGRRDEALEVLRDSSQRYPESHQYLPLLLTKLGDFTRDSGNVHEAKEVLERANGILDRAEDSFSVSRPYVDLTLGQVYLAMGMTDVAEPPITRGYEAANSDEMADAALWGTAVFRRINLAHNAELFGWQFELWQEYQGELAASKKRFEGGDATAWRHGIPAKTHAAIALNSAFGRIEHEFREPGQEALAQEMVRSALELEGIDPEQRFRGALWTAVAALDRGDVVAAKMECPKAHQLLTAVDGELTHQELEWAAVNMRTVVDDPEATGQARHVATQHLDRSWSNFLDQWRESNVRSGGVAFLQYGRRKAVVDALFERHLGGEGGSPERALEAWLEVQSLGSLSRQAAIAQPTLPELQAFLKASGKGLVLWIPGRTRSHALSVDGTSVLYHELPPSHVLDSATRILAGDLSSAFRVPDPNTARALEESLRRVTDQFVCESLRRRIEGFEALILIGTSDFGFVPFEAFGETVGDFGRRWPIEIWPSIPVGLWLGREATEENAQGKLLVLGGDGAASSTMPNRERYPELELAVEALRTLAARSNCAIEIRLAKSSERGAMMNWGGVDVLHVVAHGIYEGLRERPAGLLLDPRRGAEGAFFSEAIEEQEAVPALAILTACGSDRARPRRGDDGRARLTGAFFSAGSRAVISSSTDLELRASLEFLRHVYDALGRGETVTRALWMARNAIDTSGSKIHPVHASLMQLHGSGEVRLAREEPRGAPENLQGK